MKALLPSLVYLLYLSKESSKLKKERRYVTTRPTRTLSWVSRPDKNGLRLTRIINQVSCPVPDYGYLSLLHSIPVGITLQIYFTFHIPTMCPTVVFELQIEFESTTSICSSFYFDQQQKESHNPGATILDGPCDE
jgi:hypothetical protein